MICECVCRFCKSGVKWDLMKAGRYRIEEFTSAAGPFNGIVCHLRNQCGGNPHDKYVISITSSGNYRRQPHQLVDYGWNNWWESTNRTNSFVLFDFKWRRVCLSHYSLKSHGVVGCNLVSWVLEVSNDGLTWEAVDERDTQDLDGIYIVKTYECSNQTSPFARYVRLRQRGRNSSNGDTFALSEIEFFGKLKNEGT